MAARTNLMTQEQLRALNAEERKLYWNDTKNATYLGSIMSAYGDWNYYQLEDGTYVCNYFSIGD